MANTILVLLVARDWMNGRVLCMVGKEMERRTLTDLELRGKARRLNACLKMEWELAATPSFVLYTHMTAWPMDMPCHAYYVAVIKVTTKYLWTTRSVSNGKPFLDRLFDWWISRADKFKRIGRFFYAVNIYFMFLDKCLMFLENEILPLFYNIMSN